MKNWLYTAMRSCKAYEPLMADVLFGTPTPEARHRLEAHLSACAACATAFHEMEGVLEVTAARPRPAVPEGFWDDYEARLCGRMEREARRPLGGRAWGAVVQRPLARLAPPVPRWALQLAVAVLLVAVGVVLGRAYDDASPGDVVPAVGSAGTPPAVVQPASLEARSRQYVERSKVLLLGLVHFDPAREDPAVLNLPRQQQIARDLVAEAGALKEDLTAADQQRLHALIADLEVILLQIANLEAEHDLPAIEMVKSGVDRKALLLKINVEEMRMNAPAPAAEPSI